MWLLGLPVIRWVVNSRTFLLAWNWVIKPFLLLLLVNLVVRAMLPEKWVQEEYHGLEPEIWRALVCSAWFLLAIIANSRSARVVEEIAADGATRLGRRIGRDVIPNVFRGVMESFNTALEAIERVLYGVDEWLRFRGGEGPLRLAAKAGLGLVWAVVAYLARIYVNLLIEPQVNPIKHFPVVTVSHKLMIPFVPHVLAVLRAPLMPLGPVLANGIAGTTVFLIPGVFGFLAWELKENWRLYAANRPTTLPAVAFGHHGETMSRMLRRGFHSGTVPKLFARLRKADRRAERGRGTGQAEKRIEQVYHLEESVHQFVERGLVFILEESRCLGPIRPVVERGRVRHEPGRRRAPGPRRRRLGRADRLRGVEPPAPHPARSARLAGPAGGRAPTRRRLGPGRALRDERRRPRHRAGNGRRAGRPGAEPGVVVVGRLLAGRRRGPGTPLRRPRRGPPAARGRGRGLRARTRPPETSRPACAGLIRIVTLRPSRFKKSRSLSVVNRLKCPFIKCETSGCLTPRTEAISRWASPRSFTIV